MNETQAMLLFDWEDVLVHGPFLERWSSAASLRLSVSRRDTAAALGEIDPMALRTGETSVEDLCQTLGEDLDREISTEELEATLRDAVVYDMDGLAALGKFSASGQAAVVGGSHPGIPERLRKDLLSLVPPERHVYAHEAGHPVSRAEFYAVAAEALGVDLASLYLVTRRENVLLAAKEAGCGAIQFEGADTHYDLPEPEPAEKELPPELPEEESAQG